MRIGTGRPPEPTLTLSMSVACARTNLHYVVRRVALIGVRALYALRAHRRAMMDESVKASIHRDSEEWTTRRVP